VGGEDVDDALLDDVVPGLVEPPSSEQAATNAGAKTANAIVPLPTSPRNARRLSCRGPRTWGMNTGISGWW
jgi:hypothetical protein